MVLVNFKVVLIALLTKAVRGSGFNTSGFLLVLWYYYSCFWGTTKR